MHITGAKEATCFILAGVRRFLLRNALIIQAAPYLLSNINVMPARARIISGAV